MMATPDDILGPVNLGNPDEFTIKQLAELVLKLTGSSGEIKYSGQFREDDPMQRRPDITKAKKVLGWEPKIKLEEGLEKTIKYFKAQL